MVRAGNTDYASGEHLEHAHACFDSVSLTFLLMLARFLCLRVYSLLSAYMKNNCNINKSNNKRKETTLIHSCFIYVLIIFLIIIN